MISTEAKEYLTKQYGMHDYDYDISDKNLRSLFKRKPKDFAELDDRCRKLEQCIKHIHDMQAKMKEEGR